MDDQSSMQDEYISADDIIMEIDQMLKEELTSISTEESDPSREWPDLGESFVDSGIFMSGIDHNAKFADSVECLRLSQCNSFVDAESLSVDQLHKLRDELNRAIEKASNVLIDLLTARENTKLTIELFDEFFELVSVLQKDRNESNFNSGRHVNKVLFTSIPYDSSKVSTDIIESINTVLRSLLDNNENFPNLLTNYILSAVCSKSK
ncbi:hypothetical protein GJ496_002828 [Pomphorhynchus laevis]|nr:hypothetical protein GJ496_002828 [Pomphorhynchus laevis]